MRAARFLPALISLALCAGLPALAQLQAPGEGEPIIIAHRGASGLYPEHTLEAYEAAIDAGADFIEPDLVMTRDGVLVARHDRFLSSSTNVADRPEFADRRTVKIVNGQALDDWFVEDFTLAELKTLRARQTFPGRSTEYDDAFDIPTFVEILNLVAITNQTGQRVGLYPEMKAPGYFATQGLDMPGALLAALEAAELQALDVPVFIQSFEPESLRQLNAASDWPLIQLLPVTTEERLEPADIAAYADGVGPWKQIVLGYREGPSAFISIAHENGLLVHAYTYRADDLGPGYESFEDEIADALDMGLDGLFTDHPAEALAVRDGN